MKNLIFTTLVFLLCQKWYVSKFGDFTYTTDWNKIFEFIANEQEKWLFALITFCGVYMGAFILEVTLIPSMAALFFGKININRFRNLNLFDNNIQNRVFGSNPLINVFRRNSKLEIYKIYSFVPVCMLLFAIYLNTFIGYLLLFICLILTIIFYRFLNLLHEEYNRIP